MISNTQIIMSLLNYISSFFFFNDTATTEIYTLSLHDALPILTEGAVVCDDVRLEAALAESEYQRRVRQLRRGVGVDRKSTRLNSSHSQISYAVFCLKKKTIVTPGVIAWDFSAHKDFRFAEKHT